MKELEQLAQDLEDQAQVHRADALEAAGVGGWQASQLHAMANDKEARAREIREHIKAAVAHRTQRALGLVESAEMILGGDHPAVFPVRQAISALRCCVTPH